MGTECTKLVSQSTWALSTPSSSEAAEAIRSIPAERVLRYKVVR